MPKDNLKKLCSSKDQSYQKVAPVHPCNQDSAKGLMMIGTTCRGSWWTTVSGELMDNTSANQEHAHASQNSSPSLNFLCTGLFTST